MKNKEKFLVSACLLGVKCRHNGKSKTNKKILRLVKTKILIPVCPEIFGGLPTPREKAEIRGKKVITESGKDVTKYFKKGAEEVLKMAKLFNAKFAILKEKSPSCGVEKIYDGTFSGKLIRGSGITADLLKRKKIKVFSEKNYEESIKGKV